MTPKERAEELVDRMYNSEYCGFKHSTHKQYCDCSQINEFQAKQCALIAVEDLIFELDPATQGDKLMYWYEVEEELKNL